MRRKIDRVLWIIECVNVQINFDPIFFLARARTHAPAPSLSRTAHTSFCTESVLSRFRFRLRLRARARRIHWHLPAVAVCGSLLPLDARVVEWQTRTFEGRMPKGLRVQVPP